MESSREFSQPARASSPDSVYSHDKPQWSHDEVATAPASSNTKEHKPYSLLPTALHKSGADLSPREWLALASDQADLLSPQTRQLIESVASLQTAMSSVSLLSRRHFRRRPSWTYSSSPSSTSSTGSPGFQEAVAEQEQGLRRLSDRLSRQVDEELEQGLEDRARRQRERREREQEQAQEKRDLAKKLLKADEEEGIQAARKSIGLPETKETTRRRQSATKTQQRWDLCVERATSLTKGGWRKTW